MATLPDQFPEQGQDEDRVYDFFAQKIYTLSTPLGSQTALAHMDPLPPLIAARLVGLNAEYNQNLLHPSLSPFATEAEDRLMAWLAPAFGMEAGHMCSGSTIANLTALWCAREAGAQTIVTSAEAHLSVAKAAHILGMELVQIAVDDLGRMDLAQMPDMSKAVLVLTAGTTGRGAIDPLSRESHGREALWVHVDAAWAGPLQFTKYRDLLAGMEQADSIAISAHKWFYQPKDSALILFARAESQQLISFGGSYLATPNVGVQGSRGASAIPLLATLMVWGREGLAQRIEKNMADSFILATKIDEDSRLTLLQQPETAVTVWRPKDGAGAASVQEIVRSLDKDISTVEIEGAVWVRQVAVNYHADIDAVWQNMTKALSELS